MKNTDFTVAWYATKSFGSNNKIEVNNEYEVFASNGCTDKVLVDLERKNAPVLSYSNGVWKFI